MSTDPLDLLEDRLARITPAHPQIDLAKCLVLRSRALRSTDEATADLLDNVASVLLAQAIGHSRLIHAFSQLEEAIDGRSTHPDLHVPRRRYAVRKAIMAIVDPHLPANPPASVLLETPT